MTVITACHLKPCSAYSILVIAATVFFADDDAEDTGLFAVHDLIRDRISKGLCDNNHNASYSWGNGWIGAAFLFAFALLCAGQTASITATLAGQIVSEGFIEWRISVCQTP